MLLRQTSQRICIGCRKKKPKRDLVRMIINKKGEVVISQNRGRGAYLCRQKASSCLRERKNQKPKVNLSCLRKAVEKKAFNYAFKKEIKAIKIVASPASSSGFRSC